MPSTVMNCSAHQQFRHPAWVFDGMLAMWLHSRSANMLAFAASLPLLLFFFDFFLALRSGLAGSASCIATHKSFPEDSLAQAKKVPFKADSSRGKAASAWHAHQCKQPVAQETRNKLQASPSLCRSAAGSLVKMPTRICRGTSFHNTKQISAHLLRLIITGLSLIFEEPQVTDLHCIFVSHADEMFPAASHCKPFHRGGVLDV